MGVATAAIIGSAAVGAAGSVYGASQSSKAQAASDKKNQQNVADTNAMNYRMFRESRGAVDPETGYAASVLPLYFKGQEAQLAADANSQYQNFWNQSQGLANDLRSQLALATPASQAAMTALMGRYNGANLQQQLLNAQPVFGGRINQANAQVSGIRTGLQDVIGQLNASRAAQGFFGGSTFDRSRLAASTIGAQQAAAQQMAAAQLANATDERGLRDADLAGRADLSALTAGFQNYANMASAPLQAEVQGYQAAMQPYSFFKIGNQAFQNQAAPAVSPGISTGQAIGQVAGQLGGTALNYYLNQNLLNQYGQAGGGAAATGAGYNPAYGNAVFGGGLYS